ncbi:MAG: hypothetical protein QMD01_06425 [Thermodesulfovibrionales bacterium]|nr:hypothetical protein [Thermodesulfovibrionales bacterium]
MSIFKTLTSKITIASIVMLLLLAAYLVYDYTSTQHLKGSAKMINLAGRERMIMRAISYRSMHTLELPASPEKEALIKGIKGLMAEYEEALYSLKHGNEKLNLKPIPVYDKKSISHLNTLTSLWFNIQKPELNLVIETAPNKKKMSPATDVTRLSAQISRR